MPVIYIWTFSEQRTLLPNIMTTVLQMRKFRSNYLWMCYRHILGAHDPASVCTTRAKPSVISKCGFLCSPGTFCIGSQSITICKWICTYKKTHRYIVNKPPLLSLGLSADGGRITTATVMPATHNEIKRVHAIGPRRIVAAPATSRVSCRSRAAIQGFTRL